MAYAIRGMADNDIVPSIAIDKALKLKLIECYGYQVDERAFRIPFIYIMNCCCRTKVRSIQLVGRIIKWRRGRDSNPRGPEGHRLNGVQPLQACPLPLGYPGLSTIHE